MADMVALSVALSLDGTPLVLNGAEFLVPGDEATAPETKRNLGAEGFC